MIPLREFLGGRRGRQKEELSYITSYLKLNIPPQEAAQMLQKRDEEKAGRGIFLPLAVGIITDGRQLCQNVDIPLWCSPSNELSINYLRLISHLPASI